MDCFEFPRSEKMRKTLNGGSGLVSESRTIRCSPVEVGVHEDYLHLTKKV